MSEVLSPEARLVYEFACGEGLFECDAVIIGLSGGPDSVMLGEVLNELKTIDSFPKLYAVHVNHNIREEAGEDESFAREWASSHDIPFKALSFDIPALSAEMGRGEEETGRIMRYKAFAQVASEVPETDVRIAVAHHKDDIAETMMMNLFRGCGLEGLVSPVARNGNIIRPLLCLSKAQILDHLDSRGISYCIDKTNASDEYTRNAWRNDLFPRISEVSVKKPREALGDTYALLKDDLEFITGYAEQSYDKCVVKLKGHPFVYTDRLGELEDAIRSRVVRRLWEEIFGNLTDLSYINTREALNLMLSEGHAARQIDMPFGRILIKASGLATFCTQDKINELMRRLASHLGYVVTEHRVSLDIECGKTAILPNSDIQIKSEIIENSGRLAYNKKSWFYPLFDDRIPEGFTACNGILDMRYRNAGSNSSKSLSRLFADRHVPRQAREGIICLVRNGEIMWIPGIGASCGVVSEKSYEALVKAEHGRIPTGFVRFCIYDGEE